MNRGARTALAVCGAAWVLAAVFGGYRFATSLPDRVQQARLDEAGRRQASWSPISGFGQACAAYIPSGASVLLLDITARPLATDPAARTGPAAFGAPNDVDWPNQAAFSYAVYPRKVAAVGHLPATSEPLDKAGSYVALWDQVGYRSDAARADAAAARLQLATSAQTSMACSYNDGPGDRGWLFVTSPATAAIPHNAPVPRSLTASGLALTLVGIAVLWAIGALILGFLRLGDLSRGLWAAAALPAGCVAVAVEMLVFSVMGVRWSLVVLLVPWVLAVGLTAWLRPAWAARIFQWRFGTIVRPDRYELVAVAGLVASVFAVAAASPLALPQSDGFSLYYFKAHAFFLDGSVVPFYRRAAELLFSFPAHPPLIPLNVAWLYLFIGGVEERSSLLLWPSLYASLLGVLYVLVRTRVRRRYALWYVLSGGFVASGIVGEATGSGYTDFPLALFLLLGAGCLWLSAQRSREVWLLSVLSGIFLGAAVLTKEEGLVGTLAVVAASPLLTWTGVRFHRVALLPGLTAGATAAAVALIWVGLRFTYRLPVLTVDLGGRLEYAAHRIIPAITGLGLRLAPQLILAAILIAAVIATYGGRLSVRRLADRGFQFLAAIVAALLAGDVVAMAIAPVEIGYQLQVAAARVISQALPLFLLALVQPWRLLLEPAASQTKEESNGAKYLHAGSRRLGAGFVDRVAVRAGRSSK